MFYVIYNTVYLDKYYMIDIQKYSGIEVTDQDLDKVFTPEIVKKVEFLISQVEDSEQGIIKFSDLFQDPDFKYIMGYLIEKEFDGLFLLLEREYYDYSKQEMKFTLDFDWMVKDDLSFSNYFFLKHYNSLYMYDRFESRPNMTYLGYIASVISFHSAKTWQVGELPFNLRMKMDFYQNR